MNQTAGCSDCFCLGGEDAVVEEGFLDVVRENVFVGGALEEVAFVAGKFAGGGEERAGNSGDGW